MSSSPKYYPEFAELLDDYLATEERSGNWLAGRLKVSRSTVNRWRSGETRPDSPEIIIRIAEILGVHKQSDQQRLLAAAGYGYQMFKEPEACFTFISVAPPAPPPHFTGRRRILDALTVAINFGENIAIQGMAGIGKTATAQQLAEETKDIFSCGIFWGSLTDHDGNPLPILRAWERACTQDLMDVNDPVVLADRVCELLVKRQEIEGLLLVIVDDVREEWVDAARILKRVRPTDGPMVITTRDERLAMALDMQIHRLDPLPLEDALDMLSTSGTAELVKHETESAKELLDVIGRLPLAIKLAGARLAMLARKPGFQISTLTEQVRSRAHDALDMPGDPGLVATFSITYDTLTADQQRLFRWLSVFATGPLKVPQIAGILGMDEIQTEMALDTLVLLSVLNWGETAGVYVMHPLLRQYAAIHLEEMGEVQEAEKQHLAYFLAFAKANQSQEPDAWDRLETELPNLVLAIKRAASMQDSKALLAFEETLLHNSLFLNVRGFYQEAVSLFSKSYETQKTMGKNPLLARTLNKLAWFNYCLGQLEDAQQQANEALAIANEFSDLEQQADSLRYQGVILTVQGNPKPALNFFEKELAIRENLGDLSQLADSLSRSKFGVFGYFQSRLQGFWSHLFRFRLQKTTYFISENRPNLTQKLDIDRQICIYVNCLARILSQNLKFGSTES